MFVRVSLSVSLKERLCGGPYACHRKKRKSLQGREREREMKARERERERDESKRERERESK